MDLDTLDARWAGVRLARPPSAEAVAAEEAIVRANLREVDVSADVVHNLRQEVSKSESGFARRAAHDAVRSARGSSTEAEFGKGLEAALAASDSELLRIRDARAALEAVGGALVATLDDLAERVVGPLLPLWRALLRRVVRDVRFSDTTLQLATRRGKPHADISVPLHGTRIAVSQVASEAQTTDLQLTFLLAMALGHSWSPWRALLLDDPTQHHDIVHASAVFDVLREYVVDHQFQLVFATHDALQARFLRRKLENDGVEVAFWNLSTEAIGVAPGPTSRQARGER